MDYLDKNKELSQRIMLFVGYVLIGFAIVVAAIILYYQAYGFGVNRKGDVIQNGLTFFSSHPNPADIYVNGKLANVKTNTRLALPSGLYNIKLARNGYFDWQHNIEVNGGDVQHFDYPFLFPKELTTNKLLSYAAAPSLLTQSPDHRWLLLKDAASSQEFTLFDLKDPDKVTESASTLSLAANVASRPASSELWATVEWADDNKHVLLKHAFDGKTEFILVDRESAERTVNLNTLLKISPSELSLIDKKFDQYYVYDAAGGILQRISQKSPRLTPVLSDVIAYKSYASDTVLYVTAKSAPAGKVTAKILVDKDSYTIRNLSANAKYSLDLTKYDGTMYVVAAASIDNRAYIYKDPVGQRVAQPAQAPYTSQVLRVSGLSYVSFSPTAQYIVAQNGNRFGLYDIENKTGYNYMTKEPIDAPQEHANWMDGNRLLYVSGGKLVVFDYDYSNLHGLMASSSAYLPAFSPDYKLVYSLSPNAAAQLDLVKTFLRTTPDR